MDVAPGGAYYLVLFSLGTLIGSYLNVVSLRFSLEAGFKASRRGRSHCPYCQKPLEWYELIPILSFLIQGGKCRSCQRQLSFQYPLVELMAGLVLVFVPWQLGWSPLTILWTLSFLLFVLIAAIDLRLGIIPDRLTFLIAVLGVAVVILRYFGDWVYPDSFLGAYGLMFSLANGDFWINRLAGIVFGLLFFGSIYFLTQGKAIGFGDVKFAGALGILLGWPDVILALILAFLAGFIFVIPSLLTRKRTLKDALPFGPFMILGVVLVFFFGYHIINGYFRLFGIF